MVLRSALFFILSFISWSLQAQEAHERSPGFFAPSDTFNQKRFNYALGISSATYAGFSIGLYNTWYKQYPQESFHFFDDSGEWNQMDKVGHVYTAYFQGVLCYKGAKWTGLNDSKSILVGAICGGLFQTTIEVMDGFSTEWGFSLSDFGANALGVSIYALQQSYWKEQRIQLKVSSLPRSYPDYIFTSQNGTPTTLEERSDDLFGATFPEKFLKDYNAQTYWASINVNSFLPEGNKWPDWLCIALGYGADNLYGGHENAWIDGEDQYILPTELFPREREFYLGLDIDVTKIKTRNNFLKGLLSIFNIFKIPSPALEINDRGEFTFHLLR